MRLVSVFIPMNEMFDCFFLSNVWMCYLPERGVAMCLRRSHHPLLQGTTESVLTSCITVWYGNCSAADRKTLQRTVNTTAKIIGAPLPSILDIFLTRCSSKANSIMKDPTHPSHSLFQLLPSGRPYRSIRAPPPKHTTSQKKNCQTFLCNSSVLHTGEWACTSYL